MEPTTDTTAGRDPHPALDGASTTTLTEPTSSAADPFPPTVLGGEAFVATDPALLADPPPADPPRPGFVLRRSRTDRMLGGVCGGLAESLGTDATLLRIGFVALTVLGAGFGAVLYLAAWMLAPQTDVAEADPV